jgi:hypothetical protein
LGHGFLDSNCEHVLLGAMVKEIAMEFNVQQFRLWLPEARSSLDYEAKLTTVLVLMNNNNLMSLHAGLPA